MQEHLEALTGTVCVPVAKRASTGTTRTPSLPSRQPALDEELRTWTFPRKTAPLPCKRSFSAELFQIFFLQDSAAFAVWHETRNSLHLDAVP